MIGSYQEAQFLHSTTEALRCKLEIELQVAQFEVKWAIQKFQSACKRLTKAEFRAGKMRIKIRNSGFLEISFRKPSGCNTWGPAHGQAGLNVEY